MQTYTQKEKIKALGLLTPAEQEAAFSESVADKIQEVAAQNNLSPEALKSLRMTVGMYLLKLINLDAMLQEAGDSTIQQSIMQKVIPEIDRVVREYKPEIEEGTEPEVAKEENTSEPVQSLYHENIDRTELLKAIEDPVEKNTFTGPYREPVSIEIPAVASSVGTNPVEDRLKGIVFTPKETKQVVVETPRPAPTTPDGPKPGISQTIPQNTPKYQGADPYREAL